MAECMIALACESIGFFILSWYLSAIFPGVYGVGQRWYFPFTKTYWFPGIDRVSVEEADPQFDKIYGIPFFFPYSLYFLASDMFENEPLEAKMTVRIAGLSKTYSNGTKAVVLLNNIFTKTFQLNSLYMRLYESQITALLGHNGAGKTTTMSMLCGLYAPSSGAATIYGRHLRTEMRKVRDILGVCPQQNVLFSL